MSFSIDEILLPKYMNWSTNFRSLLSNAEAGQWSRSKDEFMIDILLYMNIQILTNQLKTCIPQLCVDTKCCLEDLP